MRELTGWWIAIDDTMPELWGRGETIAMEELLVVNADGRAENRAMNFWSGSARECAETKVCSDAPVIAAMRISVKGDKLTIGERSNGPGRVASKGDASVRRAAFSGQPQWTASLTGGVLVLSSPKGTRTFARVDPRRLQRLRAGFRVAQQSAAKQWRCFLGNATARDAAFKTLRPKEPVTPDFLEPFLKVASYLTTLDSMRVRPTPDDPAGRKYIANETEEILAEEFTDARLPVTAADARALASKLAFVMAKARGDTASLPRPQLAVSDAEITAFGRALGDDPDAKRLFCRN